MTILCIGDSFTTPDPLYTVWPSIISKRLGHPVVNHAVSGAGYIRDGSAAKPARFSRQLLYSPPANVDVVIILGSPNDRWSVNDQRDWYKATVWDTHQAVFSTYPGAHLLVITPQWSGAEPKPPEIDAMESHILEVMWGYDWKYPRINPNSNSGEWWFPPNRPELWEADKFHPSQLGHDRIADKLEPHISKLLNL
jgi:lysophospholipase L1-like esterase